MNEDRKDKLKIKLEEFLKRPAKPGELINAEKDQNLLNMVLSDKVVELEDRIKTLEKK